MKKIYILLVIISFHVSTKAQPITGEQYKSAALGSIDVLSSHLALLEAQSHYNKMLSNFSFTEHYAPVDLLMNNGEKVKGSIERLFLNMGLGYGKVSNFGGYCGIQWDASRVSGPVASFDSVMSTQVITYGGIAAGGFHFEAGYLLHTKQFAYDVNGEFAIDTAQVKHKGRTDRLDRKNTTLTVYHKTGIYFSAILVNRLVDGTKETSLSEYRFSLKPLAKYLPKPYGNPHLALIGFTPFSSYFNKYKAFYSEAFKEEEKSGNDLELGTDNINELGLHSAVTIQIRPKVAFRKFEVAYNYFTKNKQHVGGVKTQFFLKDGSPKLSFDAFVLASFWNRKLNFSVSYSYNSPENSVFLPLPKLHVFGIQFILGKRETAKAILPYATSVLSDENDDDPDILSD